MGKGSRTRLNAQAEVEKQKSAPAPKKPVGPIIRNVLIGLLLVAFVGVGIFGILSRTGVLMGKLSAFDVGDMSATAKDYRIFYKNAEMNLVTNYGTTLQSYYGVDLTQPLETQAYGDGTWGDYLHTAAQESITEVYSLYQEAIENGAEPVGDDDPLFLGIMASYRAMAKQYGMDEDEYLKAVYGSSIKRADFEKVAKIQATAEKYREDYEDDLGIGDSDIQARYDENPAAYDVVSYRSYVFPYEKVTYTEPAEGEEPEEGAPASEEEATEMTNKNIADAQTKADEFMGRIDGEDSFASLAREYADEDSASNYEDDDATLTTDASIASTDSSPVLSWCAEDGRSTGDTTTIDTGSSITVVYFVERHLPEVRTVSARHILFKASAAADDATDEEKAEAEQADADAKAKAEEVLAEWKSGDMTAESFGKLAMEYSDDVGSVTTGGLMEDFAEGEMVAEFNDWVFDEARKEGDVEIVKTTYGYHIIYFVSEGDPQWKVSARQTMIDEKYDEYYSGLSDKYTTTAHDYGISLA